MALRRGRLLLAVGLASEVVYLAAAWRLPWWRYGGMLQSWAHLLGEETEPFVVCLVGTGVLMAAYLWGWHIVRSGGGERWIIWGFAGLFAATLFWLMPFTSDLFIYLSQAHVLTDHGANPLFDAPLDFRDPLLLAYPAFYSTRPSVYGPAWLLVSAPGTMGPLDVAAGLTYLKGLAVAAFLGCAWLLERLLRRLRPAMAMEGLYLFAWNPLVLLMAVGDGHNDIVMMVLVLLATWLLLRERWGLAFGVLALSVWVKYTSVILLPLFAFHVWRRLDRGRGRERWMPLVVGGLATLSVSVLVVAPFWSVELIPGTMERLLRPLNWQVGSGNLSSWGLGLGLLLFAAVYAVLTRRVLRGGGSFQRLANTSFAVMLLAFLFGAARSQPWHLLWPAALAGLSDRRWVWPVVVGLSALMLAAQIWVEWGAPGARSLS